MCVCVCVCKVILFFVEKCKCECQKVKKKKVGCDFSSLASHVPTPSPLSLSPFAAPKVFPLTHFLGCTRQKVQPSFPTLFLVLCFFLLPFLHGSPPSLTKTKYPSLKKKLKGLTLKFHLQIVGGK